jgi:hypothetical protein
MKSDEDRDLEAAMFEKLYQEAFNLMSRFGRHDGPGTGDYYILADYWGHPQLLINMNLSLLRADVVDALRSLLTARPGWEIVFSLFEPGTETTWPPMGVRIRREEVLDGLKREFLPEPYRSFTCTDLRLERPDEIPER